MKIILTGMMGVGKTVAGKKLAEVMNIPFLDLDEHIEKKACLKISEIFLDSEKAAFVKWKEKPVMRSPG